MSAGGVTRVAVVGAGPAGLAVVEAILAREGPLAIEWLERDARPDRLLRYGPAPGAAVLRGIAARLDAVLSDPRVHFHGGIEVGPDLPWDDVRRRCPQVVAATGAAADRPLQLPGAGAVGVGTLSYLRAAAAGSPDTFSPAIDPVIDSAAVLEPTTADAKDLLAGVPRVEVLAGLEPVALVGRNRVRAVRVGECVGGRLRIRDVRAQLVLRAHAPANPRLPSWVHVAGWAGRDPVLGGSHREDAARVVAALTAEPAQPSDACPWSGTPLGTWSPVAEVEMLLARFAGEGTLPLADYDALLAEADDD